MEMITDVLVDGTKVIEAFANAAHRSFKSAFLQTGRGAVRNVVAITPPAAAANGPGTLDNSSSAKARGASAINRDLIRVFAPVRLKHKRREIYSGADMVEIHRERLAKKRPGAPMTRGRAQAYYVDVRKFNALADKLRSHVGRLAAGWLPAAQALGVTTPQWISRHGLGRGTFRADLEGSAMFLESVNLASPFAPTAELQRRVGYAVQYALNDLTRQMPVLLARNAREVGLEVSA
ncbi:MAG TPA: hypothetical protein VHD61_15720 [Lacunisphaera sp.]|nr:hypothetical protein [Lacunisphaera sp.]